MTLIHPPFSIIPLAVARLLTFPYLACFWVVLQNLVSDYLPILLSVPLSPAYRPNECPPFFNFQKSRWDGFASNFDSHCPSAKECSPLPLSCAAALSTSLALNAAKSSIFLATSNAILKPGGLLRWKVRLVKDTSLLLPLTEVMKIARLTSPPLEALRQSSPKPRLRHGRRLALLFHLNLCTLFLALSLALLPRLPPLLILPTVLPGNLFQSMPFT